MEKFLKLSALFLLLTICIPIDLVAQDSKKEINMEIKNERLPQVLRRLEKVSGYKFLFTNDDLHQFTVTATVKTKDIQHALNIIIGKKPIEYVMKNSYISIMLKEQAKKVVQTSSGTGSKENIMGKVVDTTGLPLTGVAVQIEGSTRGAITDLNGVFNLPSEKLDNVVLLVSFVGMKGQRIPWEGQPLNITMEEDLQDIEEVVITGMFERKKESFTGSAATFKKDELMRAGNQNLLKSLKNLDPAFQILESREFASDPNRTPNVQMRGQTSFSNLQGEYQGDPNQPLFILDGFETTIEKVFDLDMNRVSSITLLKDAAAKAIYGSKAGNGVVVIETIRPKTGELTVSYSGDFGVEAPDLTGYDLMNAKEKLAYEVQIGMYGSPGKVTASQAYKKVYDDIARGVDTYWLSKPLHVGLSHKHSLNVDGGDERMRYVLGMSYNQKTGVMKESDRRTLNVNATLSYVYKNLLFRNTIEISRNWANNSPYGSFSEYTSMNPYWAPYDSQGNLVKTFIVHSGWSDDNMNIEVHNPLYNATLNTKDESGYTEIRDNFSIDWKIMESLRAVGSFSYVHKKNTSDIFYPARHTMFSKYDANGMSDRKGKYTKGTGTSDFLSAQAGLNFNKTMDSHMLFANLTWNLTASNHSMTSFVAEGFGNDFMDDISFATRYEKDSKPYGNNTKLREVGVIGALNYSFADCLLLDASLRQSASSAYGDNSRWGTFWSLGAGWNIHKLSILKDNEWIRQLKLRTSFGYTGTQNIDPSQSRARYTYGNYVYDDHLGAQLVGIPNNDLKWQRNLDYNFGADLTLKRFLSLRADYYIQRTDNLLSSISLPSSTGFSSYTENLGQIENRGYELALSITPWRDDKNAGYLIVSATALHNKSKIKEIHDIFKKSNADKNDKLDSGINYDSNQDMNQIALEKNKPATLYYEGCSMTAIWGMRSLGIDPATGQEMFLDKNGKRTYTWSAADQVVIGDSSPKLSGSLGLNFGYKGFTCSVFCNYKLGGDLYNSELIARMENITGLTNLDRRIQYAWKEPGDIAPYRVVYANPLTSYTGSAYNSYTKPTSRFVQKENELYISSVSLGYDFAYSKWIKNSFLRTLKASFYMNDILRISSVEIERGTSYPFARNFSFSLQASF